MLAGALTAFLAACAGATRVDGRIGRALGEAARATVLAAAAAPKDAGGRSAKEHRDLELQHMADIVEAVNVRIDAPLSDIRETLENFEEIRTRTLGISAACRRERTRRAVREILRQIREKSEALKPIAAMKEERGEVDDGGDTVPSQRSALCTHIDQSPVRQDFRNMVHMFCEFLDSVRLGYVTGVRNESALFAVPGLLVSLRQRPEFQLPQVRLSIDRVLGEERRWLAKQLPPPDAAGDAATPPALFDEARSSLRAWKSAVTTDPSTDTSSVPAKALEVGFALVRNASADACRNHSLRDVRMLLQRLAFTKFKLEQYILASTPQFRERVRDLMQLISEKRSS